EVTRGVDGPGVGAPARVHARRRDDVAAVASDIEADADLSDAVADLVLAGAEVAVPPLASDGFDRRRQSAVRALELEQRTLAVLTVNIEHEDAADGAGGDADVKIGECAPPAVNALDVGGGCMQTGIARGLFAARLTWE